MIYREFWYFSRIIPTLFSQLINIFMILLHTFSMGVKTDARLPRSERFASIMRSFATEREGLATREGVAPRGYGTRRRITIITNAGVASAKEQRNASQQISAPLIDRIINQDHQLGNCHSTQQSIKRRIQHMKCTRQKEEAIILQDNLPTPLQRSMELAQEKGASTWLTTLPIDEHGFALHKTAFRDSLSLRYGWPLQNSPSH